MSSIRKFFSVIFLAIGIWFCAEVVYMFSYSFVGGPLQYFFDFAGFVLPHPDDTIWLAFMKYTVILTVANEIA